MRFLLKLILIAAVVFVAGLNYCFLEISDGIRIASGSFPGNFSGQLSFVISIKEVIYYESPLVGDDEFQIVIKTTDKIYIGKDSKENMEAIKSALLLANVAVKQKTVVKWYVFAIIAVVILLFPIPRRKKYN